MSAQVQRVVKILMVLSGGRSVTAAEIQEHLSRDGDVAEVSLRQIQRDLVNIAASGVPLESERDGKEQRWSMPRHYRSMAPLLVGDGELMALHALKGTLKSWRGTKVDNEIGQLVRKLEKAVPGEVYLPELVSEVSPGQYQNAISDAMLEEIITAIVDPRWDEVTYQSIHAGTTKTFTVSFCRLVDHAGRLYVIAWHPKYDQYITLAADRIERVSLAGDQTAPLHRFDEEAYRKQRFGVYDGEAQKVVLKISREGADYFASRHWHPSAEVKQHRNGSLTLTMHVPISPELISWVMSWAGVLTVTQPKELIDECKAVANAVTTW